MNDEHFALVIELGDVDPAEMVRPASIVKRGNAAVIRPDVKTRSTRVLPTSSTVIINLATLASFNISFNEIQYLLRLLSVSLSLFLSLSISRPFFFFITFEF